MKILVSGAHGCVGSYVREVFAGHNLVLCGRDSWDVTQTMNPIYRELPDVVLHLAALTDVDYCELHPVDAYRVNAEATANIANACVKAKAKLAYVSTAGVFSGGKYLPYVETDTAVAANVYGAAKLAGEYLSGESLIVRSGWMFGGGSKDRKFVGRIVEQILSGKTELKAVDDKVGSPTYAKDLLNVTLRLLEVDARGVFHASNSGHATRFDVAEHICSVIAPNVRVTAVSSREFPLVAQRSDNESMGHRALELLGIPSPRAWQEALTEYIR